MLKFATFQITSAVLVPQDASHSTLRAIAHRHEFDYEPRPGFLYVRSRAISSRTNDNYDEFPAEEIEKAYKTFIGKPVFVNHVNDNHRRARGVIIDAALHKDTLSDGSPDTWAEVLMEVDAVRFPKLAEAILAGRIDRTSMGTDVERSQCSACGNWATTPAEYCEHIPRLKGKKIAKLDSKTGKRETILIREKCVGLKFFENSLLVEEPADPTAFFLGVDDRGLKMAASKREALSQGATMAVEQGLGTEVHFEKAASKRVAHWTDGRDDLSEEQKARYRDADAKSREVFQKSEIERQKLRDQGLCTCPGSMKIERHRREDHPEWAQQNYAAGKTDAWGHPLHQAYDGHGAWNCNNYACEEHPQEMYEDGPGMPGWMQHDMATSPEEKEVRREVGRAFQEQGLTEDARYLLDQQHQGPTKFSLLQHFASAEDYACGTDHWPRNPDGTVGGPDALGDADCGHPDCPYAECDEPYCQENNFPEGWHTRAEHIDPPHLDPGHSDYQDAERHIRESFPDLGGWVFPADGQGPSKYSSLVQHFADNTHRLIFGDPERMRTTPSQSQSYREHLRQDHGYSEDDLRRLDEEHWQRARSGEVSVPSGRDNLHGVVDFLEAPLKAEHDHLHSGGSYEADGHSHPHLDRLAEPQISTYWHAGPGDPVRGGSTDPLNPNVSPYNRLRGTYPGLPNLQKGQDPKDPSTWSNLSACSQTYPISNEERGDYIHAANSAAKAVEQGTISREHFESLGHLCPECGAFKYLHAQPYFFDTDRLTNTAPVKPLRHSLNSVKPGTVHWCNDCGQVEGLGQNWAETGRCSRCGGRNLGNDTDPVPTWDEEAAGRHGLEHEINQVGGEHASWLLSQQHTGPTKYSSANHPDDDLAPADGICEQCGKPNNHIHLSPEAIEEIRAASEAGQMHAEMHEHAQKRTVNLDDPADLKAHLMEAHGYDPDIDFWRTSHDEEHPALGYQGFDDEDRPLSAHEVRRLHDWEHGHEIANDEPDYEGGLPGHFMGDSHFHTAVRKQASKDPLGYAQEWADEYPMSPVAHPDVVRLIRQFPPVAATGVPGNSEAEVHERYSKLMGNVVNHHAQEWFKDDPEGHHEMAHHLTQNYLDGHQTGKMYYESARKTAMLPAQCATCGEPIGVNPDTHTRSGEPMPNDGWHHHDGMKRDHPARPHDGRSADDQRVSDRAAKDQARMLIREQMNRMFGEMSLGRAADEATGLETCPTCHGGGWDPTPRTSRDCPTCHGKGHLETTAGRKQSGHVHDAHTKEHIDHTQVVYPGWDPTYGLNPNDTKLGSFSVTAGVKMWHGSPSGDLRGGPYGLHVGTREAARQALEARIGRRADGKDWDGTQEYGKTLLMGKARIPHANHYPYVTGYSVFAPADDHYPTGEAGYGDGSTKVPMTAKPDLFEVEIIGPMSNDPSSPLDDSRANGLMKGNLTRGTARRGYYYNNIGEDEGSVSAVVPGPGHVRRTGRRTAVKVHLETTAGRKQSGQRDVWPVRVKIKDRSTGRYTGTYVGSRDAEDRPWPFRLCGAHYKQLEGDIARHNVEATDHPHLYEPEHDTWPLSATSSAVCHACTIGSVNQAFAKKGQEGGLPQSLAVSWSAWERRGWDAPDLDADRRHQVGNKGEPYPKSHLECQHRNQTMVRDGYMQCNDCGAVGPDQDDDDDDAMRLLDSAFPDDHTNDDAAWLLDQNQTCPRCGRGIAHPLEHVIDPERCGNPPRMGKKQDAPTVSGVVLKAADTGRVLMLQRSNADEKDPARGTWEFPGGHHEEGDKTSLHAGIREWEEEVGQPFPEGGVVSHTWRSPNGIYQGHVVVIPEEKQVALHEGRVVPNPDDPDGDDAEQAAWWEPEHARKNPALRAEVKKAPWDQIKRSASRRTATWIGDRPEEPTLFWRAPKTKRWEVHIHNYVPDRDLRENYGAKPTQDVYLLHADNKSDRMAPGYRGPNPGAWAVRRHPYPSAENGGIQYTANAWGGVPVGEHNPPAHVVKQVHNALDEVDRHAQNHADLYGQMAEQQDIADDLARVPRDMEAEERSHRMFRNLLRSANEDNCPTCEAKGTLDDGKTCWNCGGSGYLRKSSHLGALTRHFASEDPEKLPGGFLNVESQSEDYWAKPTGKAPYDPQMAHLGREPHQEGHGPWNVVRHPETRAYHVIDNQGRSVRAFGPSQGLASYDLFDDNARRVAYHVATQANQDHGHIPKWQTRDGEPVEETGIGRFGPGHVLPGTGHARRKGEPVEDGNPIDTQTISFHYPTPSIEHSTEDPRWAEYRRRATENPAPQVYPAKTLQDGPSSREHGTRYRQVRHGEPGYDDRGAFHDPSPDEEWHGPYRVIQHPETGKYHVVDNQDRVTGYGGRDGIEDPARAEYMRDYADARQSSKERAKGMAERLWEGFHQVIDPGSTPESRRTDRYADRLNGLMHRYEGGPQHPLHPGRFGWDDEEEEGDEEGQPYYEVKDPGGSGFTARDYGGPNVHIYHEATPNEAHDLIDAGDPAMRNEMHRQKPPGYGHDELHEDLRHWVHGDPEETGGTAAYLGGPHGDPRIRRWQRRNGFQR